LDGPCDFNDLALAYLFLRLGWLDWVGAGAMGVCASIPLGHASLGLWGSIFQNPRVRLVIAAIIATV